MTQPVVRMRISTIESWHHPQWDVEPEISGPDLGVKSDLENASDPEHSRVLNVYNLD